MRTLIPRYLLPSVEVVAVSQAPSPKSNPNSSLPVVAMVGQYPTIEADGAETVPGRRVDQLFTMTQRRTVRN